MGGISLPIIFVGKEFLWVYMILKLAIVCCVGVDGHFTARDEKPKWLLTRDSVCLMQFVYATNMK